MGLFSRRHRGAQGGLAPVISISVAPGTDPAKTARALAARLAGRSVPEPLTARQVLTAALMRDEMLAEEPDQVATIVKDIFMDLQENGLEIVQSSEVE